MIGPLFSSIIVWVTVPQVMVSMALRFRSVFPAVAHRPLPFSPRPNLARHLAAIPQKRYDWDL